MLQQSDGVVESRRRREHGAACIPTCELVRAYKDGMLDTSEGIANYLKLDGQLHRLERSSSAPPQRPSMPPPPPLKRATPKKKHAARRLEPEDLEQFIKTQRKQIVEELGITDKIQQDEEIDRRWQMQTNMSIEAWFHNRLNLRQLKKNTMLLIAS